MSFQKLSYFDSLGYQSLPGCWDAEFIAINAQYFLILASNQAGVNSQVWEWSEALQSFQFYQTLPNSDLSVEIEPFWSGGICYLIQARNSSSNS